MLTLYYVKRMNQVDIARLFGIDPSTVSRTILRGEERLHRCLRYGAERYLGDMKKSNTVHKHITQKEELK